MYTDETKTNVLIKDDNYEMTFTKKGYGRIFVEKEEDISAIKDIINEIDPYEYKYYFNDDLITVFSNDNFESVYTHKFSDMNMTKVLHKAWERGIKCFCVFGKISGYENL
jgi:hypothetical protein